MTLLGLSGRRLLHRPTHLLRTLSTTTPTAATAHAITTHGPPPPPPTPSRSALSDLRTRQRLAVTAAGSRFWREALVITPPHTTSTNLHIHLDTRVLKTPQRVPLAIPRSKPLLATAIALEWNALRKSSDAARGHLVPLTQLASRAVDMTEQTREDVVGNLIRYLDTDTLLVWAPSTEQGGRLRCMQIEAAKPVVTWVGAALWPGIEIRAVDGDQGLVGGRQPRETREALMAWMRGLSAWELVGLERCVLASKSFLVGARMVGEWTVGECRWGVEEAAMASSVEVRFQTGVWGEVEDTHDVEKEDLRRQLGAGWLLIAET